MTNDKNNDDIEQLLNEFKAQKSDAQSREEKPLEPPKKREELIDFSKPVEQETKRKKKSSEEKKADKDKAKERFGCLAKKIFNKKMIIAVVVLLLAAACSVAAVHAVNRSKTSYLEPYMQTYPGVVFPEGILEKYCDEFGNNPNTVGIIGIGSDEQMRLSYDKCEPIAEGAERFNYVVYLETKELEPLFCNAESYNASDKQIFFTDLKKDYTFQVIGAFYINTNPDDDYGCVFPYNVTEKMTLESANQYVNRINKRLLYTVDGLELTRQDTVLTISCPTDYRKNYRFVIVCKAVEEVNQDAVAVAAKDPYVTYSEYLEAGGDNPFRKPSEWYPDIVIIDENGEKTTAKHQ